MKCEYDFDCSNVGLYPLLSSRGRLACYLCTKHMLIHRNHEAKMRSLGTQSGFRLKNVVIEIPPLELCF